MLQRSPRALSIGEIAKQIRAMLPETHRGRPIKVTNLMVYGALYAMQRADPPTAFKHGARQWHSIRSAETMQLPGI